MAQDKQEINIKPGPFDSKPKQSGRAPRSSFFKFATVLVVFFVVALAIIIFQFGGINPVKKFQEYRMTRQILNEQRMRGEFEKNDTYGGKTPEETYQLLVQALEKQDIELASKYFVRDKQQWAWNFFNTIKTNKKWPMMMDDLSGRTARVEHQDFGGGWYEIKVQKKAGTVVSMKLIKYSRRDLWKIDQF